MSPTSVLSWTLKAIPVCLDGQSTKRPVRKQRVRAGNSNGQALTDWHSDIEYMTHGAPQKVQPGTALDGHQKNISLAATPTSGLYSSSECKP